MITKQEVESYIEKIPPSGVALKQTLLFLNAGELTKAAKIAESDIALKSYLRGIVNKPIYGFQSEVKEIAQIFGILGVARSQQTVYNYMISLLSPKKWVLFKLNSSSFLELQASLSNGWKTVLAHLEINDKDIESAVSLLPASIIVTEALFCTKLDDVKLLRTTKALDYNTILQRLCQIDLFDICEQIAKKWDMPPTVALIVQGASGVKPIEDEQNALLAKWMHLLLFYELSKPLFIEAGLNDFVDFQIEFVDTIYEDFAKLMEIA
ncbi:MAG: HDOD domain-containing protein [Sulfurimonadaceae bacterium]|nr:HDOD domain-containing protein [Sulfurimonadaceae bacterium]